LCDWATNVYELRAYSPGLLPSDTAGAPPPPPVEGPQVCSSDVVPLVTLTEDGAGTLLRGDAALQPRGGGMRGDAWVSLTGVKAASSGSVEFSRVVNPQLECGCVRTVFLHLKLYVRMGGGTSMPGEGLVISMVDASKQTPGATRFLAGCGTRPALTVRTALPVTEPPLTAYALPPMGWLRGSTLTLSTDSDAKLSRDSSGSPGKHSNTNACTRPSAIGNSITTLGWPLQSAASFTSSPSE
jgi:hypothetical protein